jgi:ATP-dependent DNA helicase DinG
MITKIKDAHKRLEHIFKDLLPRHGLPERAEQMRLSHRILDAMFDKKIALCDAGTGIGKTYAYLAAGIVYHISGIESGQPFQPLIISTSSIALQNAIQNEYLPFLTKVLLDDGMIHSPIRAVVRKGKSHYVCDERLERHLQRIHFKEKNRRAAKTLLSLRTKLDIDAVKHISKHNLEQIHVPEYCDCRGNNCRYQLFVKSCGLNRYLFQICNHNLLLADAIHRASGHKTILPDSAVLIIDEAHKLPEAAQQMFGISLELEDIQAIIDSLKKEKYFIEAKNLQSIFKSLQKKLCAKTGESATSLDFPNFLPILSAIYRILRKINEKMGASLSKSTQQKLKKLLSVIEILCSDSDEMFRYIAMDEDENPNFCATNLDLSDQLNRIFWSRQQPMILTSGTLSVGEDFSRFKTEVGLLGNHRVTESVSFSPFDYEKNCLLYLPNSPPKQKSKAYFDQISQEIAGLLYATHGHGLILFTSYAAMSAVQTRLNAAKLPYPLFTMSRNAKHILKQFKCCPGSVLLAAGAAWEGFDFPGDCVSLLVIPHLPFPYPDAKQNHLRDSYSTLQEFIRAIVVPDMQIKLKQGFGRAIRTENDSCMIAILDERAAKGQRYYGDVRRTLPKMKITSDLKDVQEFIREKKTEDYFMEL